MRNLLSVTFILSLAVQTAVGAVATFRINPITTNTPAGMTNVVRAISSTNAVLWSTAEPEHVSYDFSGVDADFMGGLTLGGNLEVQGSYAANASFAGDVFITNGVLHLGASSFMASNSVAGTDLSESGVQLMTLTPTSVAVRTNFSVSGTITGNLGGGTDIPSAQLDISVKSYGAVGDGVADDSAAIQAAIDATQGAQSGPLLFPAGVYKITSELLVSTGKLAIVGAGARATTLVTMLVSETNIFRIEGGTSVQELSISGMRIMANNITNSVTGIRNVNGQRLKLKNLDFYTLSVGLYNNKDSNELEGCSFFYCGTGLTNTLFANATKVLGGVAGNNDVGFAIGGDTGSLISGTVIQSNDIGVEVGPGTTGLKIHAYFEANGLDVYGNGTAGSPISGLELSGYINHAAATNSVYLAYASGTHLQDVAVYNWPGTHAVLTNVSGGSSLLENIHYIHPGGGSSNSPYSLWSAGTEVFGMNTNGAITGRGATLYGSAGQTNSATMNTSGFAVTNTSAANQGTVFGPNFFASHYGAANSLVQTNGRVGIRTSTPGVALEVNGEIAAPFEVVRAQYHYGTIGGSAYFSGPGSYSTYVGNQSSAGTVIGNSVAAVQLNPTGGNVSFGLSAPLAALHGTNASKQAVAFQVDTTAGAGSFQVSSNGAISSANIFTASNRFEGPVTMVGTTEMDYLSVDVLTNATGEAAFFGLNGSSLTSLNASSVASGNLSPARLPNGTNAWALNTAFPVNTNQLQLISGATTGGITGVSQNTAGSSFGELIVKATGDIMFTNAVDIVANDYVKSRTITNGNFAAIAINVTSGLATNMAIVQFR